MSRYYAFDYEPEVGLKSNKAVRLVEFCLGDYADKPVVPCTRSLSYFRAKKKSLFLLKTGRQGAVLKSFYRKRTIHKLIIEALVSQRAVIPPGLHAWVVRGDRDGSGNNSDQGLHLGAVRPMTRRDLVLVPTQCRERFLGPNLKRQLEELRQSWVPWEEKSNTAWWGGALTGDCWSKKEPRPLTRREVLCYFRDHPSDQVSLHMTHLAGRKDAPQGISIAQPFTKQSVFKHKCLVLLPGNDIASGSSWYFAGNSVVLMPKPHLEHILYFEMEPWKHYVPLENDPADILVKLQWVLDNEDQAQQIVANSHKRLEWLCGPEYQWACNEVLRRICPPRKSLD